MAHSSLKPIWKYSWNPEGYGIVSLVINTKKKTRGSLIPLNHTFFRGKDFAAELESGSSLNIGYENKPLEGNEDIILRLFDPKLSQLSNTGIYRVLELVSARVLNTTLKIKVNFIADALDPEDLGQVLNQEADVVHKSLTVEDITSENALFRNLKVNSDLSGKWGSFSEEGLKIKGDSLITSSASLEKGVFKTSDPLKIETGSGKEKGRIQYNSESYLWEVWNPRAKKLVPFVVSSLPSNDIPIGGIPFIEGKDLAALSYGDWLKADYVNRTLKVDKIETKDIKITDKTIEIGKTDKVVYIGGHKFQDIEGILNIDDVLFINNAKQEVSINGVVIDKELFKIIKELKLRLEKLEKRLGE